MTTQTFTHAGIAPSPKGPKVRFTNNMATRVKRLTNGNAEFITLPSRMTKLEAANYLLKQEKITADANAVSAVKKVIGRFEKESGTAAQSSTPAATTKPATTKKKGSTGSKGAVRVANVSAETAAAVEAAIA
jgi:hypothetical protein